MIYCKRCLYPSNHPLGIVFDSQGVCSGCRIHEEKDYLDWSERLEKLKKICNQFKNQSRTVHDCIIPVSGARDSHFVVHIVKNVLGLNPLLVNYNSHYNTRMGIRNLAYLRSLAGVDFIQSTVSPSRVKKITKATIKLRGSIYWHILAGQTAFPVQTAVKFKIPLIIWGAHQGIDQVGMFSHLDEVEMTRKYRKDHDLMGLEEEQLLSSNYNITKDDIASYLYPHDKELEAVGVRGIYLNNYIRWDAKTQHELMIKTYNYETSQQQRTFDTYHDVDSFHYSGLHDFIKLIKHGYGVVTDHASREIRLKRMTREEGIEQVKKYQDVVPRDTKLFLNWLGIDEKEFWEQIYSHRSNNAWYQLSNGIYELSDSVINHVHDIGVDEARLSKISNSSSDYSLTKSRDPNPVEDKYILIGRGWVNQDSTMNF